MSDPSRVLQKATLWLEPTTLGSENLPRASTIADELIRDLVGVVQAQQETITTLQAEIDKALPFLEAGRLFTEGDLAREIPTTLSERAKWTAMCLDAESGIIPRELRQRAEQAEAQLQALRAALTGGIKMIETWPYDYERLIERVKTLLALAAEESPK